MSRTTRAGWSAHRYAKARPRLRAVRLVPALVLCCLIAFQSWLMISSVPDNGEFNSLSKTPTLPGTYLESLDERLAYPLALRELLPRMREDAVLFIDPSVLVPTLPESVLASGWRTMGLFLIAAFGSPEQVFLCPDRLSPTDEEWLRVQETDTKVGVIRTSTRWDLRVTPFLFSFTSDPEDAILVDAREISSAQACVEFYQERSE